MTQLPRLRHVAAAATLVVLLSATAIQAQNPPNEFATPVSHLIEQEVAAALPDAPAPQETSPAPQPAVASPSSSSAPVPSQTAPAPPPHTPTPAEIREQQRRQAELDVQAAKKQRLLGIMPQFQTVIAGKAVPLTPGEKWTLSSRSAIDPFYIGYALVIGGGYSELVGSHSGYHWGPGGYFKRVGANYVDNINGALIGNGLLPIVLHQDPRYFRLGTGSFGRRFLHAAISTIICKGDNGRSQPNVSNVLGNFISGAISNAYYPADERGIELTLVNGLQVTAIGAIGGQLLEFGPDLNRIILRHKKIVPAIPAAPAPIDTTPPGPPTSAH
ncbi:MAG: hypothetical protein NVSMB62_21470 [Acidobacteriaceae bacterium]